MNPTEINLEIERHQQTLRHTKRGSIRCPICTHAIRDAIRRAMLAEIRAIREMLPWEAQWPD